ncbi:MAG: response regulator transcription factor [Bacteroidales bacterium]|nr:response regulator transcription factor [Bacteroidales bacterium]
MRILIIEDEKKVASLIRKGLEKENYMVDVTSNGADGLVKSHNLSYDSIILDLMLPGCDGLHILKTLRKGGIKTPVLILTAKGDVESRIEGLNHGADDYLVKPFAFGELLARVRALLRRSHKQQNPLISFDDFTLNPVSHEVKRAGAVIEMSAKEYSLLEFLVFNADRVLNRITLSEHVWKYDFDRGTNFIDVYINRLRNKIDKGYRKKFIYTVRGYGYMFKT